MKKSINFWLSLERYLASVVERSPLPWTWVGVGIVGMVLLFSALNVKNSVVGARDVKEVIEKAAMRGDYETAKELLDRNTKEPASRQGGSKYQTVLGVESELEDKVYPERVIEREIARLEEKLKEYPGNRQLYLVIASLYGQIGDPRSDEYREKARILDPND